MSDQLLPTPGEPMSDTKFLNRLERIIADRVAHPATDSYTASLAAAGTTRLAQKVGEEAVELALAAVAGDRQEILDEAADLVYHLLVLLSTREITLADVADVLESRHR